MDKKNVSFRIKYEILDEITRLMPETGAKNMSEFVINALVECLNDEECMKSFDEKMLKQGFSQF
ncbi:hypothetical protein [Metallosphaera sedula]|uniref:hypothetical protein n=1 Tax=Metallosphaera sedula TaxID=43687 RepID=UPI002989C95A|nr:hypothetical protein [Metallosphaera sedula]MCP6728939.1 hypothetical protein [Metallosphaera sedula]